MGLLEKTINICVNRARQHEMNALDESITHVLTAARKKVEGIQRNIPFSTTKQVKESKVKCIRGLINKKKGKKVDEEALKQRKEYCEVEMEDLSVPDLEDRYTEAKIEWESFKKEVEEKQNQKLLDLYPSEIIGDSDIAKRRKKQALRSVKIAQY